MRAVLYTARPIAPGGTIYCDTSFLLDLFAEYLASSGRPPILSSRQANRARQAKSFFDDAKTLGVTFLTSVFAVEEGMHILLVRDINTAMKSAGSYLNWKDFRRSDPAGFTAALNLGRRAMLEFETLLKLLAIDVLAMGKQPPPKPPVLEAHVIADAKLLLSGVEVDAMDAFQFVTMRRFDIDRAASSDVDWLMFPSGTLYTFI